MCLLDLETCPHNHAAVPARPYPTLYVIAKLTLSLLYMIRNLASKLFLVYLRYSIQEGSGLNAEQIVWLFNGVIKGVCPFLNPLEPWQVLTYPDYQGCGLYWVHNILSCHKSMLAF